MQHELLARARAEGAPLIDDGPGNQITVTFVRESRKPVRISGDFDDWANGEHASVETNMAESAPGLWTWTKTFPRATYMEYAYFARTKKSLDPLNPRDSSNGGGSRNNFFYGPDAGPSPLIRARRGIARGVISRHTLNIEEVLSPASRDVWLYRPPVDGPTPLIIVMDGRDYYRRGRLNVIVDNLIAQGRIRPVALAMVNCSRSARYLEYACSDATVGLFTEAVIPLAAAHMPLVEAPGAHGIMGASMGGVMALYAGLRAPEVFGRVLSQSGAFSAGMRRGAPADLVTTDLVRHGPLAPLTIWMDVGRFEGLLESNQRMRALLVERGYPVGYHEYEGGHNYPSWQNDLAAGLEALYPAIA